MELGLGEAGFANKGMQVAHPYGENVAQARVLDAGQLGKYRWCDVLFARNHESNQRKRHP